MKILFFGDVYGKPGRTGLKKVLPKLIKKHAPDFVLANVENLAHGHGPGWKQIDELLDAGVDGFTSGNHIFDTPEGIELLKDNKLPLTRPANYPASVPGQTHFVLKKGKQKLFVTNLMGRVFMGEPIDNPFTAADKLLATAQKLKVRHSFVDFHAEATSEKSMMGHYLDGQVGVVVGTHTHVQTADERVLRGGTAYISDAGFCGPRESVIGAKIEIARERFTTGVGKKLEVEETGPVVVCGVAVELDTKTGKADKIERIQELI